MNSCITHTFEFGLSISGKKFLRIICIGLLEFVAKLNLIYLFYFFIGSYRIKIKTYSLHYVLKHQV